MMRRLLLGTFLLLATTSADACPFCTAIGRTITQDIDEAAIALVGRLEELQSIGPDAGAVLRKARFRVQRHIKGPAAFGKDSTVTTITPPTFKVGRHYLLLGRQTDAVWDPPVEMSDDALRYLDRLLTAPKKMEDRLAFLLSYLDATDSMVAQDAYDEFAAAPYAQVRTLAKQLDRKHLVSRIQEPKLEVKLRRLFATLLGVCGQKEDAAAILALLKRSEPEFRLGRDALVACYLTLKGPDGVADIETLFLRDSNAEPQDVISAVIALRFHGEEGQVIPRSRLIQAMHLLLDQPKMADLVIADLARWEDWSVMDRLVTMFREAERGKSFVRIPVARYLLVCPKPEAKQRLEELRRIDPKAVKQAESPLPVLPDSRAKS